MNIILCEGNTDAILISYYLIRVHAFSHYKGEPPFTITTETETNKCYWYKQKEQKSPDTVIWAVGGIDKLKSGIQEIEYRNRIETNHSIVFNKIIIVIDKDNRSPQECSALLQRWTSESHITIRGDFTNRKWHQGTMNNWSNEPIPLKILPIFLPTDDTPGSLEDFLLTTLESQPDERIVVAEARKFIATIPDEPFLPRTRLRNKACLGATLAVFSPDWVLTKLDAKLRSVPWQEMKAFQEAFSEIMLP